MWQRKKMANIPKSVTESEREKNRLWQATRHEGTIGKAIKLACMLCYTAQEQKSAFASKYWCNLSICSKDHTTLRCSVEFKGWLKTSDYFCRRTLINGPFSKANVIDIGEQLISAALVVTQLPHS